MEAFDWCTRSQWRARAPTTDALYREEVSPRSKCEGSNSFPWMFPKQARPDTEIQLGHRPTRLRHLAAQDQMCRREDILFPTNISLIHIDLTIYELAKCSSPFQALPLVRRGAGGDEGDRFFVVRYLVRNIEELLWSGLVIFSCRFSIFAKKNLWSPERFGTWVADSRLRSV